MGIMAIITIITITMIIEEMYFLLKIEEEICLILLIII